ncbi:MAG: DUF1467 family protein [Alphaproteobacteria bacterium]|nr:MAG: DUF1467 family protein [Alphaproteobacteria bacterium]
MTITGAAVLFFVIWWLGFMISLMIGVTTQADAGENEPGTPLSAPASGFTLWSRLKWVTVITVALWIPLAALILWGGLTVEDIDFWGRYRGVPASEDSY